MNKHTKLTKPERVLLAQWKNEGLSTIECGKRLGRNKSTIGRKLKRNKTQVWTGKSDNFNSDMRSYLAGEKVFQQQFQSVRL